MCVDKLSKKTMARQNDGIGMTTDVDHLFSMYDVSSRGFHKGGFTKNYVQGYTGLTAQQMRDGFGVGNHVKKAGKSGKVSILFLMYMYGHIWYIRYRVFNNTLAKVGCSKKVKSS